MTNDYRSWTFTDRSFLFAVAVSALWHLFWFFSVTIIVAPPRKVPRVQPSIVSLGAVLDDSIFKTLIETRPEISKAFYRQPEEFSTATEVPMETAKRYASGDVVSVPEGQKFASALKDLVGGQKSSPTQPYYTLSGGLSAASLLSAPLEAPGEVSPGSSPTEIEFALDAGGHVVDAVVVASSGDAVTDLVWEKHLRQWIFTPGGSLALGSGGRGRVSFHKQGSEG